MPQDNKHKMMKNKKKKKKRRWVGGWAAMKAIERETETH
jgi:hypothetical protein